MRDFGVGDDDHDQISRSSHVTSAAGSRADPGRGRGGSVAWHTDGMKRSIWEANPIFGAKATTPPDRYLFHYTSVERCAAIGFTGSIALGPLTPLNDPRESQSRQIMTRRSGARSVSDGERQALEGQLWCLRSRVRLACFTMDRTDGAPSERDDRRGYAHSRMWTQYANGHSGVCLIFDRSKLLSRARATFRDADFHHGAVEYTSGFDNALLHAECVDFDAPDATRHHRSAVVRSLFVKNRDWESETEYRLLVDGWADSACLLPIGDALVGIVLGVAFMKYQLHVVSSLAERYGLNDNVAQLIVNTGVLQAWPSRDEAGALRLLEDADTRGGRVFDPEDSGPAS